MDIHEMESIIEALLFASGDPVPLESIAEILELDIKTAKSIMSDMELNYRSLKRGIMLQQIGNKYQLCTKPKYGDYIVRLLEPRQKQALSQAAFEALSIIAYKQPVTRARIEQIRGVNSDSAISRLLERGLIREAGRLDAPGKPLLYETTEEFLRSFGFKSIKDLPILEMNALQELNLDGTIKEED